MHVQGEFEVHDGVQASSWKWVGDNPNDATEEAAVSWVHSVA
jgi:hypothetical protein